MTFETLRPAWDRWRPWLGTVIRLFLGAVWIWASLAKLHDPRKFVEAVRAYDATPEWLSKAIGYGMPVLELSIGVLLVLGVATRLAAAVSAVLFFVFLIGLSQAAARGLQLSCGCFGGGGATLSTQYTIDILRDIGLLILAGFLAWWSFTWVSIDAYLGRHDYVEPPSAKRMRSEAGVRKYNALIEQKQKAARERSYWINGAIASVIILVSLIGIGIQASRAKIQGSLFATNATVSEGVVFGKAAAATVNVYEDFQCPNCRNFEAAVAKTMDADVRANRAQVHFHSIAILDSSSNRNYSTRAANAALCASDVSVDTFVAYHNYLFQPSIQPAEGTGGLADNKLEGFAGKVGITGANQTTFDSCVTGANHKALVEAMTEDASKKGINSTPTVIVNGHQISPTLAAYEGAVREALKHGPKPSPSVTPTPTPTPSATSSSPTPTATTSTSASASASKKKKR